MVAEAASSDEALEAMEKHTGVAVADHSSWSEAVESLYPESVLEHATPFFSIPNVLLRPVLTLLSKYLHGSGDAGDRVRLDPALQGIYEGFETYTRRLPASTILGSLSCLVGEFHPRDGSGGLEGLLSDLSFLATTYRRAASAGNEASLCSSIKSSAGLIARTLPALQIKTEEVVDNGLDSGSEDSDDLLLRVAKRGRRVVEFSDSDDEEQEQEALMFLGEKEDAEDEVYTVRFIKLYKVWPFMLLTFPFPSCLALYMICFFN